MRLLNVTCAGDEEPLGPRARAGRVLRRLSSCGGCRAVCGHPGQRHRCVGSSLPSLAACFFMIPTEALQFWQERARMMRTHAAFCRVLGMQAMKPRKWPVRGAQAAASGSRRISAAWSASSRRMGGCHATASSRMAPPWTAWGRWRGALRTLRCCWPPLQARGSFPGNAPHALAPALRLTLQGPRPGSLPVT
jgi:hypothetical protein